MSLLFISDRLLELTVILFCFMTGFSTFILNRKQPSMRLLGMGFLIPVIPAAVSMLSFVDTVARPFFQVSIILFLLYCAVVIYFRPVREKPHKIVIIQAVVLLALWCLLSLSVFISGFASGNIFISLTGIAAALAVLASIYLKQGFRYPVFYIYILPVFYFATFFSSETNITFSFIRFAFAFLFFLLFSLYFFTYSISRYIKRISSAEKQLEAFQKGIEKEVRKRTVEIEEANRNLINIAKTDPMTRLFNKAAILDILDRMTSEKSNAQFSILMFDIDHFKTINDTKGHTEGDKCIKKLARLSKAATREQDMVCRFGGDEFIIILPEVNTAQAMIVAERLRKKVITTETPHMTISIGVATFPDDALTTSDIIKEADNALYISKSLGRNTVSCVYKL